jgi:UTP--glucose-1-phosphate uridylyltransferase
VDHFDYPYELEQRLLQAGKKAEAKQIRQIADLANFIYVRQEPGIGNGVAIKSVSHLLKEEPFLVLWGDILADPRRSQMAVKAFEKYQRPILCGSLIDEPDAPDKYGYIKGSRRKNGIWDVAGIVEKPGKANLPSPLAVCSGYVLTPDIFPILEQLHTDQDKELYLTDAINILAAQSEVLAIQMDGIAQYDTGTKLAYIETFIKFALMDKKFGKRTREILKELLNT